MTKKAKRLLTAGIISLFLGGVAVPIAAYAGSSNDHVLHENSYDEYFKQEGHGDKNYLYTKTEFTNSKGEHCTVVTGASERWGALDCNPG